MCFILEAVWIVGIPTLLGSEVGTISQPIGERLTQYTNLLRFPFSRRLEFGPPPIACPASSLPESRLLGANTGQKTAITEPRGIHLSTLTPSRPVMLSNTTVAGWDIDIRMAGGRRKGI